MESRRKSMPVGFTQERSIGSIPGSTSQSRQSEGCSSRGVPGGPSNDYGIEPNSGHRAENATDNLGTASPSTKPEQYAGLSTRKNASMPRSKGSSSGMTPSQGMETLDLTSSARSWMPGAGTIRGAQASRHASQGHKSHTMKRDKHTAPLHVDSFANVQDDFMARAVQRSTKLASSSGTFMDPGHGDSPAGDTISEQYTTDHIRLLYMIFCHTTIQVQNPDEEEEEPIALDVPPVTPASYDEEKLKEGDISPDIWIRKMPLMVMLYEGIVKGVFESDYAPAADLVDGCRVYLNLTQEGRDDLDDLRESGLIFALKVASVSYVSTVAFRVTPDGVKLLRSRLTQADIEAVNSVIFAPDGPVLQSSLLRVKWDPAKRVFVMYSTSGYSRNSTITDVESVSYVSSPWIPKLFRRSGRETTDNAGLVGILESAKTNIKDELNEVVNLDELKVFFGEWIPMGANQIVALNDRLGSSERVQGGLFTAAVDLNPLTSNFQAVSTGLTEVRVLDYDEPRYVNFEAEVHFPEEEGIVQIENFGVHINEEGFLAFGMTVDGIMDRVKSNLSLDHLSRLMVDVYIDSSKVLDNLLSPHQRLMLNTTYANHAEMRKKYVCICASAITPLLPAASYLDKEARENELKQVIGDTISAHDLDANERLIVGKDGLLLISSDLSKHEPILMSHLSLMSRNLFMSSLFQRSYILMDRLKQVRSLIYDHEANPNSVSEIRNMLSQCNADIILLNELQLYLTESLHDFVIPEPGDDPAAQELCKLLHPTATLQRLHRRIRDMVKSIRGSDGEADGLRSMVDAVSESQNHRVQEAVQDNTKNLEDVYRANARASTSLEIMQVVLAGSLAFDLFDRVHGLYLGDAALLTWPADVFRPIYDTAGALLGINLACWLILGLFIKFLLNHFATQAAGWMAIRYTINIQYDLDAMEAYLKIKQPEVEGGESDKATVNQKYSWTEQNTPENRRRWAGEPPKIEITLDTRHRFLLKAFIQVVTRRSKIDQAGVRQTFFGELREAGVIQGFVAGIEEAPGSDGDQDETESGDGKSYMSEVQKGAQGMMRRLTAPMQRLASSISNHGKVVPEATANRSPPFRTKSILKNSQGGTSNAPSSINIMSSLRSQMSQDLQNSSSFSIAQKPPALLDAAAAHVPPMGSIRAQLDRSHSQRMQRSSISGMLTISSPKLSSVGPSGASPSSKLFGKSSFNAGSRSFKARAQRDVRAAGPNQINYIPPTVEDALD